MFQHVTAVFGRDVMPYDFQLLCFYRYCWKFPPVYCTPCVTWDGNSMEVLMAFVRDSVTLF